MKICKSAHFQFDDDTKTVAFVWGRGKSRNAEILHYTNGFYSTVKKVWLEFLQEPDLRTKVSKLAHAINLGSEDERIKQICFMLEAMWRYDFSKTEALGSE